MLLKEKKNVDTATIVAWRVSMFHDASIDGMNFFFSFFFFLFSGEVDGRERANATMTS